VPGEDALNEMRTVTAPGRLDSAYGFDFLYAEKLTPELVARVAHDWPEGFGWPSWAFENHDAPRALSRWASEEHRDAFARMKMLLLSALRGSIILYQGEELGLPQSDVPFDRLQDPEAIANWPHSLGRDGARTPIPWNSGQVHLGFSTCEPWLPFGKDHRGLAVDEQNLDEGSLLHFTRRCLQLRKSRAAMTVGAMEVVEAGQQRLVFDRSDGEAHLRCSFNLSDQLAAFHGAGRVLIGTGEIGAGALGPYSAVIEEIA
jgi:alpha-glucosidase